MSCWERNVIIKKKMNPAFQSTKTIQEELQILLAPDKEHQKVFPNVPVVGFSNGENKNEKRKFRNCLTSYPK